jgi:iron complex outermembrane receptor protein
MDTNMNKQSNTLLAMAGCLLAPACLAEDEAQIEHVIVTAPLHKTEAETALPVTVLAGDELRDKAKNTIGETLNLEPGISSSSFGPGVGQPIIRGQGGNRVSVIQNGIVIRDAASISPDHANATEALLAESIEVIRGPATLLYGSGTIGGVVNVIDNRIPSSTPEFTELSLEYRHDTVNDQNTVVGALDTGTGPFALHLDGSYRKSNDVRIPGQAIDVPGEDVDENTDGFIGNSNAEANSATAGLSWSGDWGYAGFSASRLQDNYGIPPGTHDAHGHDDEEPEDDEADHQEDENIRIDLDQRRYDAKTELYHPASWIEALRLHLVRNEYQHVELEGEEVGTRFTSDSWNLRTELVHHQIAGLHGAFGLDYGNRDFEALGEEAFIPASTTQNVGLFLLEDFHVAAWTFELGARAEYQHIDPDPATLSSTEHTPWSVSASALWDVSDNDNLSAGLSWAQRAPQVEELYSNATNIDSGNYVEHAATGSIEIGDPDLDAETSWNLELGWRHSGYYLTGGVNLFYSNFSDYIYLQNTGMLFNPEECGAVTICGPNLADEGVPVYRYQQQAATFRGIEVDLNFPLFEQDGHDLNLDLFGDYVRGTLNDSDDDVPRMPPARIGTQLNYDVGMFSTYLRVFHGSEQNNPGNNETATAAWTRIDAALYLRLPVKDSEITAFLKGNNLTNEEIRSSTSFLRNYAPEPGRGVTIGLRFDL